MFLGVPFNIASYALLTRMVADQVGLAPGDFIWVGGDCHVYGNHVDQVREQLAREVLPFPVLDLAPAPDRKSTRLNSSHANISYAVFCLKKKITLHRLLLTLQTL